MMIKRLFRQHTSIVITIPKTIVNDLGLRAGDYMEIEVDQIEEQIKMARIKGRIENERSDKDGKNKQH